MKHTFSILLIMCVLMVIGAALVPWLDISNEPRPERGRTLTISYGWNNASAKVVEQNVTSRIEAVVSSVRGVEKVSSVSYFGYGRVTVELKPKANVSAVKFEIASILRQMRGKLPEGVSYPTVSGGEVDTALGDDNEVKLILTYMLNADMS
ncbi:MAG: efflux RND transporter permease subunit, partial [Prevotellaceae bacterium]|nr:efflux RND transporter permease subunit [Prevotellaceae bacterium]